LVILPAVVACWPPTGGVNIIGRFNSPFTCSGCFKLLKLEARLKAAVAAVRPAGPGTPFLASFQPDSPP
jgi:hypothetical protein